MIDKLIQPASPVYQGQGQPTKPSGGLFAQLLCHLFGGGTPAYQGTSQPTPRGCGLAFFGGTPAYRTAPPAGSEPSPTGDGSDPIEQPPNDPIETRGITIVVG